MSSERTTRRRRREQEGKEGKQELAVEEVVGEPLVAEPTMEPIGVSEATPVKDKKTKAPRKKKEGVTLKHLAEAAKLLGTQSSAGARAFIQHRFRKEQDKALALSLMQLAAKQVRADNRKRVLLRDVELVLGLLHEVSKIYESMSHK